ncbi:F510_1955 family glycosylhydrolase [Arthrobacter oryzae]|uniref:F510_1955 family glycosylhydrolase n=1 Tax=Arthrobacter oryzae TaxID=409290 RepID=UPI00273AC6C2|nr:exo-alpha-sialidase [Arthrobacter oryzae]WLQ07889.1 exo-alpha-sialidase [Arthrobacter oryzae]
MYPSHAARRGRLIAAVSGLVLFLTGCSAAQQPTGGGASQQAPQQGLPNSHVHGLSVNGETGKPLLATHDGLFDLSANPAVRIGPGHDLMGFTAGPDQGTLYASGHPEKGSTLPDPLGLMRSTDGGATWEPLSRQGASDFHALTTTASGFVAFDDALRVSSDGKSWQKVAASFVPAALAGSPDSNVVLGTTAEGLQRSADGGRTWTLNRAAPVLRFVAFVGDNDVIGVEPGGAVHQSRDGGSSWVPRGTLPGEVYAIDASSGSGGSVRVWAATSGGLLESEDAGVTFRPHSPS